MSEASPVPGSPVKSTQILALFLVSLGLLMLQVALTKVFSVVLWYHFGFLVISIAMLGFATAGVWLARRPELLAGGPRLFAGLSTWAALWAVVSLWLVVHTEVDAMHLIRDRNEGALAFLIGILLVPFFFLGAAVSAVLTLHRGQASKVYSANLLGSGAGCALAVVLFDAFHLSATDVVLWSAAAIGLGGLLFSLAAPYGRQLFPLLVTGGIGALLAWPGRHAQFYLDSPESKPLEFVEAWTERHLPRRVRLQDGREFVYYGEPVFDPATQSLSAKTPYDQVVSVPVAELPRDAEGAVITEPASLIEFTEWTSLSRVDAFTWPASEGVWGLWGLSPKYQGPDPRQKGITIDTWAMTNVLEWDRRAGPPPEVVEYLPASLVHRIRKDAEVLCIGAGGGMDLLTAKRFGQRSITGVEINPSIVKAVQTARDSEGSLLDFQGRLYDPEDQTDGVEIVVSEGRHFLERDARLYDVVQLSGVDTASTTQAGAFSLSENFLYTEEAFDTYLAHTKPGGIVTLTRWVLPDQETGHPREELRLMTLAWGALERAGVGDPAKHILLVESQGFAVILFGKQPFTPEELATLDQTCAELEFKPLFHPARPSEVLHPQTKKPIQNWFETFASSTDKAAFLRDYPYDVAPPTDDRPFFFEVSRFRHLAEKESFLNVLGGLTAHAILALLLIISALVSWFFVIQPLWKLEVGPEGRQARRLPVLFYFGSLGLGFIFVEVVLAQQFILFLGNPLYSLAVVLFSVLIFSGLGAALSARLQNPLLPLLLVVLLAAGYPFLLERVFDAALMLPDGGRIAISVALLAPLALAMGMPFALGLRKIAHAGPQVSAWAWGINGYTSVVGSVLTVVLSISLGFRLVVWVGAGVYLLALLAAPFLARKSAQLEPR